MSSKEMNTLSRCAPRFSGGWPAFPGAASLIPSDNVKYGWKVTVRSSIVSPYLIASAGSVIISPASAARICAPMIFRLAPSATSFTNPRVSRAASERGTCSSGNFDTRGSMPCARAWSSVSPTEATAGSVNVTFGRAVRSRAAARACRARCSRLSVHGHDRVPLHVKTASRLP